MTAKWPSWPHMFQEHMKTANAFGRAIILQVLTVSTLNLFGDWEGE